MVNSVWRFLAAGRCLLCGLDAASADSGSLCAPCAAELPRIAGHCRHCGVPLPAAPLSVRAAPGGNPPSLHLCGKCQLDPPPYNRCIAPLLYQAPVSQLIAQFKYGGRLACGRLLSEELLRRLQREPGLDADLIAPVPLHWRRRWTRGFNQAEIIGDELSHALRLPLRADLLARTRPTPPQQSLSAKQRRMNLRGAFALAASSPAKSPAGRHIALIDDVVTTGATVGEISRLLLAAGARSVQVWCLARTP